MKEIDIDLDVSRSSTNPLSSEQKKESSFYKEYIFRVHEQDVTFMYNSCKLFSPYSRVRYFCVWYTTWCFSEYIALFFIFANSVVLALYDYTDRDVSSKGNQTLNIFNHCFTAIFGFEALVKIVAMGLFFHSKAYLRDIWNILDITVVGLGLLEALPWLMNLRGFRALRVLRTLKFAYTFHSLKEFIESLLFSIQRLFNVLLFLMIILLLFSLVGNTQFSGDYHNRCRLTSEPVKDIWPIDRSITRLCDINGYGDYSCPENRYCGNPSMYNIPYSKDNYSEMSEVYYGAINYDDIGRSFLASFQVITLDSWADIMYKLQDTNHSVVARIFFPILVFIGCFFSLNLIVASIVDSFQQCRQIIKEEAESLYEIKENSEENADSLEEGEVPSGRRLERPSLTKRTIV